MDQLCRLHKVSTILNWPGEVVVHRRCLEINLGAYRTRRSAIFRTDLWISLPTRHLLRVANSTPLADAIKAARGIALPRLLYRCLRPRKSMIDGSHYSRPRKNITNGRRHWCMMPVKCAQHHQEARALWSRWSKPLRSKKKARQRYSGHGTLGLAPSLVARYSCHHRLTAISIWMPLRLQPLRLRVSTSARRSCLVTLPLDLLLLGQSRHRHLRQ